MNCTACAGKLSDSSPVRGRCRISSADCVWRMALRMRRGPSPGVSASASHARRSVEMDSLKAEEAVNARVPVLFWEFAGRVAGPGREVKLRKGRGKPTKLLPAEQLSAGLYHKRSCYQSRFP